MQSHLPEISSVDQWAQWLDLIAQNPHQHEKLVQIDEQIYYFDEIAKQELSSRKEISVLTSQKIIQITHQFWQSPTANYVSKQQMLKGIVYLHQERQNKYKNLFFLFKWIANLRGIKSQLREERTLIENLKIELEQEISSPLQSFQKIEIELEMDENPSKEIEEQPEQEVDWLEKQFSTLFNQKDQVKENDKKAWYEIIFDLEKKVYQLKKKVSPIDDNLIKKKLKEIEKRLEAHNAEMPRFKHLIKAFGDKAIKSNLEKTMISLCSDKEVTDEEKKRDAILFQKTEFEILALYTKRLIKSKHTDLSLSLITAIERVWQQVLDAPKEEVDEKIIEDMRVIFDFKNRQVFLKEGFINKGSYKAAFALTSFLDLKKEQERYQYVILQPLYIVEEELKEIEEECSYIVGKSVPSQEIQDLKVSNAQKEVDIGADSGCIIIHESTKSEEIDLGADSGCVVIHKSTKSEEIDLGADSGCVVIHESVKPGEFDLGEDNGSLIIHKDVEEINDINQAPKLNEQRKSSSKKSSNSKLIQSPLTKESVSESKKIKNLAINNYQKEAENCLKYGHLPGLWPTIRIMTLKGEMAIVQLTAKYALTIENEEKIAISLADMSILYAKKNMPKKDQLVYLDMLRDLLIGVQSLHQANMIHRDLKPENVLCSSEGRAGVSDLGSLCRDELNTIEKAGVIGTPLYIAPEVVYQNQMGDYNLVNKKLDIWSLGLIFWECLSNKELKKHPVYVGMRKLQSTITMIKKIGALFKNSQVYESRYLAPEHSSSLAYLVWECTRPQPDQRPTIENVLERYQAWAKQTAAKLQNGEIDFIHECFEEEVLS